jgi:hypothetical protein
MCSSLTITFSKNIKLSIHLMSEADGKWSLNSVSSEVHKKYFEYLIIINFL